MLPLHSHSLPQHINPLIKKNLDEYLLVKEKNKSKKRLSWKESKELLFKYIEKNNKIPSYKVCPWYYQQKFKILSKECDFYINLSENKIIKDDLNEYLEREKNMTYEEHIEYLFKFVKDNNRIPKKDEFSWYNSQKTKYLESKDSDIYKILSKNEVLKKDLDEFIEKYRKK